MFIYSVKIHNPPDCTKLLLTGMRDDIATAGRSFASPRVPTQSRARQGLERQPDRRRTPVWYGPIGSGDMLMKNASRHSEISIIP